MEATDQGKHARLRHGIPDEYGKNPTPPATSFQEAVIENQCFLKRVLVTSDFFDLPNHLSNLFFLFSIHHI